jgi:hypothetical protein
MTSMRSGPPEPNVMKSEGTGSRTGVRRASAAASDPSLLRSCKKIVRSRSWFADRNRERRSRITERKSTSTRDCRQQIRQHDVCGADAALRPARAWHDTCECCGQNSGESEVLYAANGVKWSPSAGQESGSAKRDSSPIGYPRPVPGALNLY